MTRFSRFSPLLALALFCLSRAWIMTWPALITDTYLYWQYAMRAAWTSFVVYQDYPFGYPLFGWLLVKWPAYLDPQMPLLDFRFWYRLSLCLAEGAFVFGIFGWMKAKGRSLAVPARALLIYTVFTTFFGDFLYDRLDLPVAFSFFFIYLAWLAEFPLGLGFITGFLIKLVPIGPWPFKFLEIWRDRPLRALLFAWVPVACLLSFWVIDKTIYPGYFVSMTEHGTRGIQVESLWATPFFWEKIANIDPYISVVTVGGADEIDPTVIAKGYDLLSRYAGMTMMAILALLFWRRKMDLHDPRVRSDFLLLFFFCFFSLQRVLSPQFLIWASPFLALSLAYRWCWAVASLALAYHALTYVNFGDMYWRYIKFEPVAVASTSLRNLCIFAIFVILLRRFWSAKHVGRL